MNQKGFGLIGIIIAVVILASLMGGGLYLNTLKQKQSVIQIGLESEKKALELKKKIEQQTAPEELQSQFEREISICNTTKGLFRDQCFYNLAKKYNDYKYCELIEDCNEGICPDLCLKDVAITTNDEKICQRIPDEHRWTRDDCYTRIGINKKDASYCVKVENSTNCFSDILQEIKNIKVCEKILDYGKKVDCVEIGAIILK